MTNPYEIQVVHILSEGEQVAWVLTPRGGFIVGSIPDARHQDAQDAGILAKAQTLDEAETWFRKHYGI